MIVLTTGSAQLCALMTACEETRGCGAPQGVSRRSNEEGSALRTGGERPAPMVRPLGLEPRTL